MQKNDMKERERVRKTEEVPGKREREEVPGKRCVSISHSQMVCGEYTNLLIHDHCV